MRMRIALLLLLSLALPVVAQDLLDDEAASPAATLPSSVHALRDIHYGADALQTLDVYRGDNPHNAPVIVMVHGGGWRIGDKSMGRMVESKVARWVPRGFVFVSVDYGLLPRTPVSRQVDDVAHALAFVQQHAPEWGGAADAVILMGHSAGAHLVDVLAAAPQRAFAAGARPWLGTISLDSAALDVARVMRGRHLPLYDAAFGSDASTWKALSPIELVKAPAPPLLLVCSTLRPDDSCGQSHRFAERAAAMGVRTEVREEKLTHGQINFTLGAPGAYTDAVERFMNSLNPHMRDLLQVTP